MKLDSLKNSFGDLYTQLVDQKCCEIIVNCKEEIYYEASGKIHRFEGKTDEVSEMLKAMAGLAEIKITEEKTNLRFNIGNIAISASTPKVSRKVQVRGRDAMSLNGRLRRPRESPNTRQTP